jgi:hypothetical protein
MKVIQSYIAYKQPDSFVIEKEYAYIIMLSSLLLKKHYGNVTLYTNEVNFRWFSEIGFPYEYNINIVDEWHSRLYSLSKFASMRHQTEPFIHVDLDTFIFKKPNLDNKKSPFIFSHPDIKFLVDEINKKEGGLESIILSKEYEDIFNTYLTNYYMLSDIFNQGKVDWPGKEYITLSDIPNMNFIGIKDDISSIHDAIDSCLNIIENTHLNDSRNWNDSHFIEQFCLPIYLKKYNIDYYNICKSHQNFDYNKSQFLLESNPLLEIPNLDFVSKIENNTFHELFPIRDEINQYCSECWNNHDHKFNIESIDDFKSKLNFNSLKYYHVGGGNKNIGILQSMIIGHIIEEFGEEYVMRVHNFFRDKIYKIQNLENQISQGEYIYEFVSGNKIFTKKYSII